MRYLETNLSELIKNYVCVVKRTKETRPKRDNPDEMETVEVITKVYKVTRIDDPENPFDPALLKSAENPKGKYEPMNQRCLAVAAGLHPNILSDFNNLRRTTINIGHFLKIADALNIDDAGELLKIVNTKKK